MFQQVSVVNYSSLVKDLREKDVKHGREKEKGLKMVAWYLFDTIRDSNCSRMINLQASEQNGKGKTKVEGMKWEKRKMDATIMGKYWGI